MRNAGRVSVAAAARCGHGLVFCPKTGAIQGVTPACVWPGARTLLYCFTRARRAVSTALRTAWASGTSAESGKGSTALMLISHST